MKTQTMNLLQEVCNALGTQGGTLAQYDREYVMLNAAFGEWHKHCPKGYVLFIGTTLMNFQMNALQYYTKEYSDNQQGYIVKNEVYQNARKNGMFLIKKQDVKSFDKELILNDRY